MKVKSVNKAILFHLDVESGKCDQGNRYSLIHLVGSLIILLRVLVLT